MSTTGNHSVDVDLLRLWIAGWAVWLVTGAAAPLPPWSAATTLAREQARAGQLALQPGRISVWSADLGGGRQHGVLTTGWTPDAFTPVRVGKAADGRTFAVADAGTVELAFPSPGWEASRLLLWMRSSTGDERAVRVALDGRQLATAMAGPAWGPTSIAAFGLAPGLHHVTLESTAELQLDGIAIVPQERGVEVAASATPPGDCGYAGWLQVGLDDRPALFVCGAAQSLEGARVMSLDGGRVQALYGFDGGRASGAFRTLLAALNGLTGCALTLLLPGLAWTGRRGLTALAPVLGISTLIVILSLLALRLLGLPPTPILMAACLAFAAGLGLWRLTKQERRLRLPWPAVAVGLAVLVVLAAFAGSVVPPLDDQDLEVQATAAALAQRQLPLTVTDRGTTYFFAHPPLLHFWVASSFALNGRLERVADAAELAILAQLEAPFREPARDEYPPLYLDYWERLLNRFASEPQLWPTRQVNVLLGALAAGVLVQLVAASYGSIALAVSCGLLLASFPEFLVRASYGGYFAATTLLSLVVLASGEHWLGLVAAGGLAALSDQKGLLLPLAWALAVPRSEGFRRLAPLAGGLAGIALFAAWGLAVAPATFLYDFVELHVRQRLALDDLRFASDPALWYPSIPELWREFARNYGLLFTLAAAWAALRGVFRGTPRARVAAVAVLMGALVFSLTDWRQTKHLSLLAAPAIVALADAFAEPGRKRRLGLALLLMMIVQNLWLSAQLATDFESLTPSTIW